MKIVIKTQRDRCRAIHEITHAPQGWLLIIKPAPQRAQFKREVLIAVRDAKAGAPCDAHDDLVAALQTIVTETMAYPPVKPYSTDSHLPPKFLDAARAALAKAGAA